MRSKLLCEYIMIIIIIIMIIYLQSIDPIYSRKDKNRIWIWSTAYELISYIIYTLSNKYKQFVKNRHDI
jgi:hypothetical protein